MENDQELELGDLLKAYRVEDADAALLDRIVARAADSKVIPFARPRRSYPMFRNAAIAAALAVLGFFCGSASLPTTISEAAAVTTPATNGNNLDRVILGPKSYSEMAL